MQIFNTQTVADGEGTAIADILFLRGGISRVVAKLAGAGTSVVEYTVDDQEDVRNDPVTGIDWVDAGSGPTSATPVAFEFVTPVTAVRIRPTSQIGTLKSVTFN